MNFEFRIFTISIVGILGLIVSFFSIRIFRNKMYPSNRRIYFGGGFLSYGIAGILNVIYYIIKIGTTDLLFYSLTTSFQLFGAVLFNFFLVSLYSIKFTKNIKLQYWLMSIITLILFFTMIPMVFYNVKMDDLTDWHPVYSIEFSLYYLVIILILATYTIFNSVKSYHNLTEEKAKKKWRLFSTGLIGGISTLSIPSLVYYLPPENIIRIYFTFGYFLLIPFVLLIYLGLRNKN
jgi:hypothetical protein